MTLIYNIFNVVQNSMCSLSETDNVAHEYLRVQNSERLVMWQDLN